MQRYGSVRVCILIRENATVLRMIISKNIDAQKTQECGSDIERKISRNEKEAIDWDHAVGTLQASS